MITRASRFFLVFAGFAYAGAIIYGLSTGGHVFGVFSLGYKEGVGEHLGYSMLIAVAVVALGLGLVCVALRDADPEAEAQVARLDAVPAVPAPVSANYWPVVTAFAMVAMAVGLVVSSALFTAGLIGLGIVIIEWAVKAWSDRQTGDPEVNRVIRNRLMLPVEIPVGALLVVGVLVVMVSRVFLATSKNGSAVVAVVVAVAVLAAASLIATRPKASANVISALLLVAGVAVIGAGIFAASVGPRDFEEEHVDEPYEQPPVGGELPPERPDTTTTAPEGSN